MPPTRGHDLKLKAFKIPIIPNQMPPTRGHDLKLDKGKGTMKIAKMPPTRGHDLKHSYSQTQSQKHRKDAPHTGARLETHVYQIPH